MPEELTIRIRAEGSEQVQRALASVRRAIAEVGGSVRVISRQTSTAFSSISEKLATLQKGFAGAAKVLEGTGQTLRRWGTILTGTVIGTVGMATKTFMDFETRLMEIQTIARLAPQDLQQSLLSTLSPKNAGQSRGSDRSRKACCPHYPPKTLSDRGLLVVVGNACCPHYPPKTKPRTLVIISCHRLLSTLSPKNTTLPTLSKLTLLRLLSTLSPKNT